MTSLDRAAQSSFPWGKGGAASGAAACGSTVSKGTKFPDESLPWGFTEETPHSQCPRGTWQGFTTAPQCLQGLRLEQAGQLAAPCLALPFGKV